MEISMQWIKAEEIVTKSPYLIATQANYKQIANAVKNHGFDQYIMTVTNAEFTLFFTCTQIEHLHICRVYKHTHLGSYLD